MIFETLWESSQRDELILLDGLFCHFHFRKDGQITIREIISQKPGQGKKALEILKAKNPVCIFAKCPAHLESNNWYKKNGFILVGNEISKTGKTINHWRLETTNHGNAV